MRTNQSLLFMILVSGFLLFTATNNLLFGGLRLDLTQSGLYTLSEGTKKTLADIEEPINLYFFYSEKVSEDLTSLRAYASRVKAMLEEYQLAGGEKINLEIIDPHPFSEEEDQAAAFGLTSVPVNSSGDDLYFGLAGTNATLGQEIIGFFQPDREQFLEYELTKLVHTLGVQNKPKIGIFTSLPINQSVDPTTYQPTPAWVVITQLEELFDVDVLDELSVQSVAAIDILLLVHPKSLVEAQLYAVDQFVMRGKKLFAFVDPLAEMDAPAATGMNMPNASASDLNILTSNWGVTLRPDEVLGDAASALLVGDPNGAAVRHLGILGFADNNLSRGDVATAPLEGINMATVGIFDIDTVDGIKITNLIESSAESMPLPTIQFQFLSNPAELQNGFSPTGQIYPVAVRVSGHATTAFPEGLTDQDGVPVIETVTETDQLQVVLVADTDVLSDRLWVQVQSFFGQQVATAFADNGSFVTNVVDNLSGSSALIDIRSRGQYSRPFTVVQDLRRSAEASYLQNAEDLQRRLDETERKLTELESTQQADGLITLTADQENTLREFQDEKLIIRKALRDVRHQLDKDIESLGSMLKLVNILLLPLLLTGILLVGRALKLHKLRKN